MLFQTLDDKAECVGICSDGQLYFQPDDIPQNLSRTWNYAPYLRPLDIEYASLYLEGGLLNDCLPEYLKDDWEDVSKKLTSFKRSLDLGHVNLQENCFYDLVPKRFLLDFCGIKDKITSYVFENIPRPHRYDFYHHVACMLGDISTHPVNVDHRVLQSLSQPKLKNQIEQIKSHQHVVYKQFGTKTGRLSTAKNSFPILTLNKSLRSAIKPTNDYFIEIDFNGAEVRTLMGILNMEQPTEDVHNFHLREVFPELATRDEAKVSFFAWLYGSRRHTNAAAIKKLESYYNKTAILKKHYQDSVVTTPYNKIMSGVDSHHALNYLIQSTAAELTLKQSLKIERLLSQESQGSHLAFIIHDAVVLDMKKEDLSLMTAIVRLMSSTNFGKFEVNIKQGTSLGLMKEVKN
jgi:hypothetical protein